MGVAPFATLGSVGDAVDEWCPAHGIEWHARVHEAGHAVAALDYGIPIRSIVVHATPSQFDGARPGESANGGVRIDVSALEAARSAGTVPNLALFIFVMAGATAEEVVLGHGTPRGAAGDIRQFWAWTKGRSFIAESEYVEVLGETLQAARQQATSWVRTRTATISAVASRLTPGREFSGGDLATFVGVDD